MYSVRGGALTKQAGATDLVAPCALIYWFTGTFGGLKRPVFGFKSPAKAILAVSRLKNAVFALFWPFFTHCLGF